MFSSLLNGLKTCSLDGARVLIKETLINYLSRIRSSKLFFLGDRYSHDKNYGKKINYI